MRVSGIKREVGGMPKKVLWLIIIFTILFIIGANSGELGFLNNLANTV